MANKPIKPIENTMLMPLLQEISKVIAQARQRVQQLINTAMVQCYWQIGHLIVEHEQQGNIRASYGKQQLQQLSKQLTLEFGKGFDVRNLRNMRSFYLSYPNRNAVRTDLSWTHYRSLIRIKNAKARAWYEQEAVEKIIELEEKGLRTQDVLRDPYILDFLNLPQQQLHESNIEQALLDNVQGFLLELGKGFAFVGRQQRIHTEDQDFYIDLVFYHFKLKCFLLIDLKLGKLSHQDVGQMDTYVRIFDQQQREKDDNPTIGLILCSQKSEAVVKYSVLTDSKQLFAAKYLPYLPSEAELRQELERERHHILARLNQQQGHDDE